MKMRCLSVLPAAFLLLCQQGNTQIDTTVFELLSRWDADSLPTALGDLRIQYSSCWGMAVNGHEYAIAGGAQKIIVLDVTDPRQPFEAASFRGSATTIREFKSYKNRLYGVAGGGSEGLQIIDFSEAPDTIRRTYYSNELFPFSHTISLDTVSGRIYLNGGGAASGGVTILDISSDPDRPQLLGHTTLPSGYVHDSYVHNDTLYTSSGFTGLIIYDIRDPLNPRELARLKTGGYNHNSWRSSNNQYLYYTEEIPEGKPVHVVSLHNLNQGEIEVVGSFLDRGLPVSVASAPIPHNLYIRHDLLLVSQYEDGLMAYDITDPVKPVLIGQYDTHPQNSTYNGYYGNWGNYPWLPSGNIVTTDMQNGVFMLRLKKTVAAQTPMLPRWQCHITPNPTNGPLILRLSEWGLNTAQWQLLAPSGLALLSGHIVSGQPEVVMDMSGVPTGLYFLQITNAQGNQQTLKLLRQ